MAWRIDISVNILLIIIAQVVSDPIVSPCRIDSSVDHVTEADCSYNNLVQVPQNLPITIETLLLQGNPLTQLNFTRYLYLKRLDLSHCELKQIEPNAFSSLRHLENLSLFMNGLCYKDIQSDTFQALGPTLLKLDLRDNTCGGALQETFLDKQLQYLKRLQYLGMALHNIPEDFQLGSVFEDFTNLTTFDTQASLRANTKNISNTTFFTLRNIPLTKLILRYTRFQRLASDAFVWFPHLDYLDLSCNKNVGFHSVMKAVKHSPFRLTTLLIDNVQRHSTVFVAAEDFNSPSLSSLYTLSIQYNHIVGFDGNVVYKLNNLQYFSAGFNTVFTGTNYKQFSNTNFSNFLPNIHILDLSYMFYVYGEGFLNTHCQIENPEVISTSPIELVNDVAPMKKQNYPENVKLIILPSRLHTIFINRFLLFKIAVEIPEAYFDPDNQLKALYILGNKISQILGIIHGLLELQVLDVTSCELTYIKPGTLDEMTSLRYLFLKDNSLTDNNGEGFLHVFNRLSNLIHLDLSQNSITALSREVFSDLTKLEVLDLSKNKLQTFEIRLISLHSLKLFNLSFNAFRLLSNTTMHEFEVLGKSGNMSVSLSGNNINCSCQSLDFIKWYKHRANLYNITFIGLSPTCYNSLNTSVDDINIKRLGDQCQRTESGLYVQILIPLSTVTILGLLLLCVYKKYKWRIALKFYRIKSCVLGRHRHMNYSESRCLYDAYIAHDSEDYEWVNDYLRPNAIDWGLNICLATSHFKFGQRFNNIVHSSHVILILTPSFVRSQRCEIDTSFALVSNPHKIVIVLLKSVRMCNIFPDLRRLIETTTVQRLEYPGSCLLIDDGDEEATQDEHDESTSEASTSIDAEALSLFWCQLRDCVEMTDTSDVTDLDMEDNDEETLL